MPLDVLRRLILTMNPVKNERRWVFIFRVVYIKRSKETLKGFHKGSKTPKSLIKNGEDFTT